MFSYSIDPNNYNTFQDAQQDYYLYRFFILNESLPEALICKLIGSEIVSLLLKAKICLLTNGYIKSLFRLVPFNNQLYLADRYDRRNKYMVYLSYDSLFMASYILLKTTKYQDHENTSVLDIGCGSGVLSLCLGDKKYRIDGIDINPRAIKCAEINARLNGIKHANFWAQDLSKMNFPQDSYRLVVFNPPFVFMPKSKKTLDSFGGNYGIEVSLKILHHLNRNIRSRNEFLGIVQSPILFGQDVPIFVERSQKFSNLAINFEIVGEMPPFEKYLDFYRKYKIEKIVVMVANGKAGSSITLTKNFEYMKKSCFG